jgi:hypothetical protein
MQNLVEIRSLMLEVKRADEHELIATCIIGIFRSFKNLLLYYSYLLFHYYRFCIYLLIIMEITHLNWDNN